MNKVLEGDLSRFEVPDLLNLLSLGARTGVLVLERSDEESKLFIREGRPVFAASTKEDLRLGSLLVRLGKLSSETLEGLLGRTGGRSRLGQILLSEKLLTEAELGSFLKIQVSEVIFEAFAWREGLFSFWDGITPPPTAVTLDVDPQSLVIEGVRRFGSKPSVPFADLGVSAEQLANPERVKQGAALTPDEWKVFFLVDGRRTLGEVCHLAGGNDARTTLHILHNLRAARFIALVPPPAVGSTAPASAPKAAFGTLQLQDAQPKPPPPVSVEFPAGLRPRNPDDDTKDVVSPKAVQYLANAEKLTVSRLVLIKGGEETSFPLIRDAYTLGRHRNNDIVISDPKVSSFHARIDRTPDGFVLVDLKSRNGSFVNGRRIGTENALLKTGDEVRLGTARLAYKVDYTSAVS
jgi:hypothetical protein